MNIGYARVSTTDQRLDLQRVALKGAGCQRILQEKISGDHGRRPELARLLDQLRPGDTVVVWRLDRLARSTRDLLEIAETIKGAGASFRSLSEPWADATSHAGTMIMTILAGIAEFERAVIRERTGAGRLVAQRKGIRFGRPQKLNEDQRQLAMRLLKGGNQWVRWRECSRSMGPPFIGCFRHSQGPGRLKPVFCSIDPQTPRPGDDGPGGRGVMKPTLVRGWGGVFAGIRVGYGHSRKPP
ncbi:recombinase family protein [Methylomagnum sp.]